MNIMNSKLAFQPATPTPDKRSDNIGSLLLDMGKLTPEDAERVLRLQKIEGLRFGDAALKLGLVSEDDIRLALSLQFDYPYLQPGQGDFDAELVAAYQPFSAQVEALRALRSQLLLRWFGEGRKTLALVSANPDEGCSRLAANLAVVFSQLGEHTLLIDVNLREPRQHKIFRLGQTRGLSDILAGRSGIETITRVEPFVNLSVLGAGTTPPNPQELLARPAFTELMNHATGHYDVILVDTPPLSQNSDALPAAAKCHGALLVSRLNRTRVTELASVREQITLSGARIVGAVVNDF